MDIGYGYVVMLSTVHSQECDTLLTREQFVSDNCIGPRQRKVAP